MMVFFSYLYGFTGPHLQFLDEVTALQLEVDKLTVLGVNKIIALGHSGFAVDKKIAKKVRGVDVVIGGHTNTFLFTGMYHIIATMFVSYMYNYYSSKNVRLHLLCNFLISFSAIIHYWISEKNIYLKVCL